MTLGVRVWSAAGPLVSKQEPPDKQMNRANGKAAGACALGVCVCLGVRCSLPESSCETAVMLRSSTQSLQALSLALLAHHAEFCLIHF